MNIPQIKISPRFSSLQVAKCPNGMYQYTFSNTEESQVLGYKPDEVTLEVLINFSRIPVATGHSQKVGDIASQLSQGVIPKASALESAAESGIKALPNIVSQVVKALFLNALTQSQYTKTDDVIQYAFPDGTGIYAQGKLANFSPDSYEPGSAPKSAPKNWDPNAISGGFKPHKLIQHQIKLLKSNEPIMTYDIDSDGHVFESQ